MSLLTDFGRALAQLSDPRFLRVLLMSLGITIAGLIAIFWLVMYALGWLVPDLINLPFVGEIRFVDDLAFWTGLGLMFALSVVLMVPTAAVVVGLFLDQIVTAVEDRHYPDLPPVEELGMAQQITDSLKFLGVVVGANLIALLIYLTFAPLAPFIFWIVNGYLLGREYFTLVAMRRLGPEGAQDLRRLHSLRIWLAGILMVIPLSVPILNLIIPILGVAVFTHQYHRL